MRKVICAILTTIALVTGLLIGAATPSQAGHDPCTPHLGGTVPSSCLDYNKSQFHYIKAQVGANPYSYTKLRARYGNTKKGRVNARLVQKATLYITHGDGVSSSPKLVKKIPWPSYKAKSVKKYRKTKYSVYEIYGIAPGDVTITWKYGITRQADENTRPRSQYSKCEHWFATHLAPYPCSHVIRFRTIGWFSARTREAALTTQYALYNKGYCPPGMPKCV